MKRRGRHRVWGAVRRGEWRPVLLGMGSMVDGGWWMVEGSILLKGEWAKGEGRAEGCRAFTRLRRLRKRRLFLLTYGGAWCCIQCCDGGRKAESGLGMVRVL